RAPRLLGILLQQPPTAARLENGDADRVSDDVVELARDARPLLRDRGPCPFFALTLEHDRAILEQRLALTARTDQPAGHERREDDDSEEHEPAEVDPVRIRGRDEDPQRDAERDRADLGASPGVR